MLVYAKWRLSFPAIFLAFMPTVSASFASAADSASLPNVLIITTDQQSVDAMSALGNEWVKTPNLDSLAAQGVYFRRSYTVYPLCSPARASLHTGRPPHEIGVDHNNMAIDQNIPISGEVFLAAGYDTGYAGKWHIPDAYPSDGIAGFEVLNNTTRNNKLAVDVDEATKDVAVEFLGRKREKPFLLVVSFINPHDICLPAGGSPLLDQLWERYQPAPGAKLPPLPENFDTTAGASPALAARARHADWDETQWRKYRYAYYRMMEDVDAQIGQILAAIQKAGAEDNTLIVFTSDHGEGQGSHRWTGKMMFYEEEAAVPLLVSFKGRTPERIDREHLVSTVDVLPTICDYAGIEPPAAIRGASLRGVIENAEESGHEYVVSEMAGASGGPGRSFMVRTRQYKYMAFPAAGGEPSEMLFDMETDPGEMKNLAGEASLAGQLGRHRQLLAEWRKTTEEEKSPIRPAPKTQRRKARAKT